MMTYTGTVKNGVVVFDDGAPPDGTAVRIEPIADARDAARPGGLFQIGRRAVPTGQPDLATNLDHHLYGHPKVCDDR